jgi:hypothetical protein
MKNRNTQGDPIMSIRLAFALAALAAPSLVLAATPAAFLERAQNQSSAAQYRSFSVPVTGPTGQVKYFDVTVDLTVQADGTLGPTANVTSVPSPKKVKTNLFVGGAYKDPLGASCTVDPNWLPTGRQETAVTCTSGAFGTWQATWQNGDIDGNSNSTQLIAAGIDKINWQGFAWGLVLQSPGGYDRCLFTDGILGARQDGALIVIGYYGSANTMLCGMTLTPA